jgi:Asp-tRNA(Asn)/Glu-tRNA(Gln) amidotransferase A subunit family amidase
MTDTNRLLAAEAVARLSSGSLTAEQLTRDHLDRIEARASVKAWTHLDPDYALAQAIAADRAGRPGLLAGLPIGVKDVIDTADMPTQHGSPIYRGNRPFADAACVALTRMAGGTILGKTVTTEFANRFAGATVNPHNPAHTPAARRAALPPASPIFRRRLALAPRPAGRRSGPRRSAASLATSRALASSAGSASSCNARTSTRSASSAAASTTSP